MPKRLKTYNLHARTDEEFGCEIEDFVAETTEPEVETVADLIRVAVRYYIDHHPTRIDPKKTRK